MRLVPLLALASSTWLVCGAQSAKEQAPRATSQTAPIVAIQSSDTQGCPVAFQAQHAGNGGLVQVSPGQRRHGQGYQVSFLPKNGSGIAQARITLHGMAGAHVIPAGTHDLPDATESYNLSPSDRAKPRLFRSTVYTEKLTGVQWIELNELTYTDGTHWEESATEACRITPNGFMLVAANH